MKAIVITGYLSKEVTEKKDKAVRETTAFIRSVIKKANGSVRKLEVLMGTIYITLKDAAGVQALKDELSGLDSVRVEEPEQAVLIFMKNEAHRQLKTVREGSDMK